MSLRRSRPFIAPALIVVLALLAGSAPVRADTAAELAAARTQLASVQRDLDRLVGQYDDAQARLARTQDRIAAVQTKVDGVRDRMRGIQRDVSARARQAYISGAAGTLELLLSSDSFAQFSDRFEFLGEVARGDADLMVRARVTGEELRRQEADLARLSAQQTATVASLRSQEAAIQSKLSEAAALEARLQDQLSREQAAARAAAAAAAAAAARAAAAAKEAQDNPPPAPVQQGGGPLQACPVGNPHSFSDTFGDPRPGGRTHQGTDLIAPLGTPIYAAQTGRYEENYNDLGGIAANVYGPGGDSTYYAHMSSRAGVGNGATVSAGTVIGYVGHTGNTVVDHLHFEYHPGGGAATNPYPLLVPLC